MRKIPKSLPPEAQAWVEARQRYHLSHAQVQMARELGLSPGGSGAARIRRSVDLPEPFAPTSPITSPEVTTRFNSDHKGSFP
jgi:hypothetical protein